MCGFVAIVKPQEVTMTAGEQKKLREKTLKMSAKIRHRGPDWSGVYCGEGAVL